MEKITLKNFRCFREEQTARLAPLTLLVGENSSGKTSFLALIRTLWDMAYQQLPNFKEDPFDLGSFDEIAHHGGARGGREKNFEAGFYVTPPQETSAPNDEYKSFHFKVTFGKQGTIPVPVERRLTYGNTEYEVRFDTGQPDKLMIRIQTAKGTWQQRISDQLNTSLDRHRLLVFSLLQAMKTTDSSSFIPLSGSPDFTSDVENRIGNLLANFNLFTSQRPFASAPVRSKPRRTYDPSLTTPDPEGDYAPMYLANLYLQKDSETWIALKEELERFGKAAGLFDEISIAPLGKRDSGPFQIQVRKFDGRRKGPPRNLIDVGYGVSQVLPVIIELLRQEVAPPMFLIQQPEVHLHPSAQAALGSLFCQIASPNRQLIVREGGIKATFSTNRQLVVETHSDHLLDRVRMDVRDGTTGLKPEDVSILYFERGELDVRIHSLRIDEEGNILGAPEGYRRFFMDEVQRSLWKR